MRDSSNFIEENRYGESRRIIEEHDDGGIEDLKERKSQAIDKLSPVQTCISVFKTFVGLGVLF